MVEKTVLTGGVFLAFIPELRAFLTFICLTLFVILGIQIYQALQRCKERTKRIQRIQRILSKGGRTDG